MYITVQNIKLIIKIKNVNKYKLTQLSSKDGL